MRYIIASDYDGTLRQNGGISARTVDAIKRFREAGHLFGVVTGRDCASWMRVLEQGIGVSTDFNIVANGAQCIDGEGNTIFVTPFKADATYGDTTLAEALVKKYYELGFVAGGISFERERMDFKLELPTGGKTESTVYSSPAEARGVREAVMSNAYWATLETATEAVEILRREFGEYLAPAQNGRCLDITAAGVDKATGLAKYAELMGVAADNIWTVGDNFNDIPMLKAYHGCAIRNGLVVSAGVTEVICDEVADVVDMLLSQ